MTCRPIGNQQHCAAESKRSSCSPLRPGFDSVHMSSHVDEAKPGDQWDQLIEEGKKKLGP
ncbi:hypothetical protein BS17DRAFT_791818, partial [Gyrodon lividus]